jgi:hypothetical protein
MDYLRTVSYNSLAYFILDRLGLVEVVAGSTGIEQLAGNSAKFALAYTGIGEAMDFMDDGRSALTTGQYFALADTGSGTTSTSWAFSALGSTTSSTTCSGP